MIFPYHPKALLHKAGGRIHAVVGIGHEIAKPHRKRSRDTWHYICQVQWYGTAFVLQDYQVAPWMIVYEGEYHGVGHMELIELSQAMTDYLVANGAFYGPESKHEGWYAHDRSKT
jgi:hypothetical protein